MTSTDPLLVADCVELQAGDRVDVHICGDIYYCGLVEETMPCLHLVWVRELGTGQRRMFSTDKHRISLYTPPDPAALTEH